MPQTNLHHFQYTIFPSQAQHQTMNIPQPTTSVTADTPSLLLGKTPVSGSVGAQYYRSACGTIKMNPYHPSNRGKENKRPTRDSLSAQKPCRLYPSQHQPPSSPPYGFRYAAQVISRRGVSSTSSQTRFISFTNVLINQYSNMRNSTDVGL
jgi:hypothetical protein